MIILFPVLEQFVAISLLMDLFNGFLLFSGVYAVAQSRRYFMLASLSGVVFFAAIVLHRLKGMVGLSFVIDLSGIVFFSILIYAFCCDIIKREKVTADVISGALAVYLLMAALWAFTYELLYRFFPGAFNISETLVSSGRPFLYFSLVTITTLGFGDISPVSPMARSLVILEAVVGQIYLVVVVAMLVGMHVSQKLICSQDDNRQ